VALRRKGRLEDAIAQFRQSLSIDPENETAHSELGDTLLEKGLAHEAAEQFRQAVRINPSLALEHANAGRRYLQQGLPRMAVPHLEAALAHEPVPLDILNDLAWVLSTCPDPSLRDGPKAVKLASQAEQVADGKSASVASTLAAAYAESGRFPEAIAAARRALELASHSTNAAQMSLLRDRINLYLSGQPFRDPGLAR
jgi:tetratricopeptide (TPR) repeat protein